MRFESEPSTLALCTSTGSRRRGYHLKCIKVNVTKWEKTIGVISALKSIINILSLIHYFDF